MPAQETRPKDMERGRDAPLGIGCILQNKLTLASFHRDRAHHQPRSRHSGEGPVETDELEKESISDALGNTPRHRGKNRNVVDRPFIFDGGPFLQQQDGETVIQLLPPWVALGNKELHPNQNTLQRNVGEACWWHPILFTERPAGTGGHPPRGGGGGGSGWLGLSAACRRK